RSRYLLVVYLPVHTPHSLFFIRLPPPPRPTLFSYTTLFRSRRPSSPPFPVNRAARTHHAALKTSKGDPRLRVLSSSRAKSAWREAGAARTGRRARRRITRSRRERHGARRRADSSRASR